MAVSVFDRCDPWKKQRRVMYTKSESAARELDRRTSEGIDVRLLWHPAKERVLIVVEDTRGGESFEFEVDGASALDAFRHPYAYANRNHLTHALAA
jgi:hypothetical protein